MKKTNICLSLVAIGLLACTTAEARDWYVCAERGKGKKGTKEQPAKDLGNIIAKLEAGDHVFIAEGLYRGRGEIGHDKIEVPVEIYGGWNQDFSNRDPWGAHKTVLTGNNLTENCSADYRLMIDLSKWRKNEPHRIVVDGVITDNGDRNRYSNDMQVMVVRTANPKTGQNATPNSGGIYAKPWKEGDAVVRNCIVLNTAPSEGAFSVWGHQGSEVLVENNLAVNNTGNGFNLHNAFQTDDLDQQSKFTFHHNTSVFQI